MKHRINFPSVAFAQTQTPGHPLAVKQFQYDGRIETLIGVNPARVLKEIIV